MSTTGKRVRNTVMAVGVALATMAAAWAVKLEPRVTRLETMVEQMETVPADVSYIKGQIDILVGEQK